MGGLGNTAPRDANQIPALLGTSSSNGEPVTIYADPITHRLKVDVGGSSSSLTVTDGITTVTNVTTIDFTSGAVVTNGGGGTAEVAVSGGSSGITIGSTTISGGTTTRILYDNAGVVGEYTLTGTGTVVVMQTSPTLITPVLGVATATTINKITITQPATGATLTIDDGFTLHVIANATVSGTNTGDQNVFTNIPVSGQTTVTANSTTTALTLIAGTNITITTDNTAKSITINSSGSGGGSNAFAWFIS